MCYPAGKGRKGSDGWEHPGDYGRFDGVCGPCLSPFIAGMSVVRKLDISHEENERLYKESQQQRYMERRIRAQKTKADALAAAGDAAGAKAARTRAREMNRELKSWCAEKGRAYYPERVRVTRGEKAVNDDAVGKPSPSASMPEQALSYADRARSFTNIEQFDTMLRDLRERREALFAQDTYDKAETDYLANQIFAVEDQKGDFTNAFALADGDLRLVAMLRGNDVVQVVQAVDEIADREGLPPSHWNGQARLRSEEEMKDAAGYAHYCDADPNGPHAGARHGCIDIRQDFLHEYTTAFHEDMHQRSRDGLFHNDLYYAQNSKGTGPIEEATVQMTAEELMKSKGLTPRITYVDEVNALRSIHKFISPRTNDYDYAKMLLAHDPITRYNMVKSKLEDYRRSHPNMRSSVRDTIDKAEKVLFSKGENQR